MKFSLFILFLLIGISHGFFGNIGQAITDLGNNVNQGVNEAGNQVQNGIDQAGQEAENALNNVEKELEKFVSILLDVASGIQFAANFLWDSIFSPAFDMIIDGKIHSKQSFILYFL
jgi:predicted PurR-regulated permease PerM